MLKYVDSVGNSFEYTMEIVKDGKDGIVIGLLNEATGESVKLDEFGNI